MGRFCTGDLEYKFWVGVQPSEDLFEYGIEKKLGLEPNFIEAHILFSRLTRIKVKVNQLKKRFRERFRISYRDFREGNHQMAAMGDKAFQFRRMQTTKWNSMAKLASLIDLGEHILSALEDKQDDLWIAADP